VLDARQQPIASVAVLASSVDPNGWVISRQILTDANGAFALAVRTGSYAVKAVPPTDPAAPALSAEVVGPVPPAVSLTLTCPDKSRATGTVLRPDGQPAGGGYQVTAIRFSDRLVAGRAASTTATDANGSFTIVGDAGQYRVEIGPPVGSGLPRTIVALDLTAAGPSTVLPPVKLSPPLSVVGTVTKQTNTPVAGATVDFLALDATGARSILIGSGVTDALGRYQAVLPDVAAPAAMVISP
jgi:hypothetical protein